MNALLEAVLSEPRQAQQLDAIAQFLREGDIERRDMANALDMDIGEIDGVAEGNGSQKRELMRRIDPVDIKARIGFGVAEALRFGQDRAEIATCLAHLRQDVVAGAVENSAHTQDVIGGKSLAQRLQDR